jgi:hypothetical protein
MYRFWKLAIVCVQWPDVSPKCQSCVYSRVCIRISGPSVHFTDFTDISTNSSAFPKRKMARAIAINIRKVVEFNVPCMACERVLSGSPPQVYIGRCYFWSHLYWKPVFLVIERKGHRISWTVKIETPPWKSCCWFIVRLNSASNIHVGLNYRHLVPK